MKTANTKIVEIWGGFHNQMTPIRVRVPKDWAKRKQDIRELWNGKTRMGSTKRRMLYFGNTF